MTEKPAFSHIDTWVFDLDNTLYPHHVNLWQQVDKRIGEYIAGYLKVPADEARRIQKDYYRRYGTSMRGMMSLHGVNPTSSAMFEDLARNLVVPHQLGMTTVLVVPDGTKNVVREDWELEGRDAAHVDHVTDDLTGFLQGLSKPR